MQGHFRDEVRGGITEVNQHVWRTEGKHNEREGEGAREVSRLLPKGCPIL